MISAYLGALLLFFHPLGANNSLGPYPWRKSDLTDPCGGVRYTGPEFILEGCIHEVVMPWGVPCHSWSSGFVNSLGVFESLVNRLIISASYKQILFCL